MQEVLWSSAALLCPQLRVATGSLSAPTSMETALADVLSPPGRVAKYVYVKKSKVWPGVYSPGVGRGDVAHLRHEERT